MRRKRWLSGFVGVSALGAFAIVYFWGVRKPPHPPAARLPASARLLLQPFHKNDLDLTLGANGEVDYRIAMQAGATLVYSWSASRGARAVTISCQFADRGPARAAEAHGAFVAQSSGWYRWRWNNPTGDAITIHLKLSGHYEPSAGMPYDR